MDNSRKPYDDLQEIKGGDWLTQLGKAAKAFNMTPHGTLDAPPNDLPANVILEQSNTAAV